MFNLSSAFDVRRRVSWLRRTRCRAAVTLELILALPCILLVLAAIITFGMVMSNLQQVALASREGAKLASEQGTLSVALVKVQVDRSLESAGFGPNASCRVILQHDVPAGVPVEVSEPPGFPPVDCECGPPTTAFPPTSPGGSRYVRVTVCVKLTDIAPNLLCSFGLDFSDCVVEQSTTLRYELIP